MYHLVARASKHKKIKANKRPALHVFVMYLRDVSACSSRHDVSKHSSRQDVVIVIWRMYTITAQSQHSLKFEYTKNYNVIQQGSHCFRTGAHTLTSPRRALTATCSSSQKICGGSTFCPSSAGVLTVMNLRISSSRGSAMLTRVCSIAFASSTYRMCV